MFITMGIVSSRTLRRRSRASRICSPKPELGTEDSPGYRRGAKTWVSKEQEGCQASVSPVASCCSATQTLRAVSGPPRRKRFWRRVSHRGEPLLCRWRTGRLERQLVRSGSMASIQALGICCDAIPIHLPGTPSCTYQNSRGRRPRIFACRLRPSIRERS